MERVSKEHAMHAISCLLPSCCVLHEEELPPFLPLKKGREGLPVMS